MCNDCKELSKRGVVLPRRIPEHRAAFTVDQGGAIVVFELLSRVLLAYVEGAQLLAVVDPTARPGLHDEVLYIKSRP
jgi:hypothetical protein